jgi:ketosteroid isomerase-like protein
MSQDQRISIEDALRELDRQDAQAVLAEDVTALDAIYSPDHLLHFAPARLVRTKHEILEDIRVPRFHYSSYSRTTEHVALYGDIAVTIGREVVAPHGKHPNAGQTLDRRYTHIWRNEAGLWRLLVRHVNVVASTWN